MTWSNQELPLTGSPRKVFSLFEKLLVVQPEFIILVILVKQKNCQNVFKHLSFWENPTVKIPFLIKTSVIPFPKTYEDQKILQEKKTDSSRKILFFI